VTYIQGLQVFAYKVEWLLHADGNKCWFSNSPTRKIHSSQHDNNQL